MASTRVLHVVGPAVGGMHQAADGMVAALRGAGVDAELMPLSPGRLPQLVARLRDRAWDAVHAHGFKAAVACRLAAAAARVPRPALVASVHGLPRRHPGGLARLGLRRALAGTALLPVSEAVAAWLRGQLGLVPAAVVPPPLALPDILPGPAAARRALGLPEGVRLVGCVARLAPEKGVDLLLEAWAVALRTDPALAGRARLVVVGDGPEAPRLRRLSHRLGLETACTWTGHVPGAGRLLRAFDAVAIPSRSEGLGLVALEALAAGVPVLAARVGGLVEALGGGRFGTLLPPGQVASWAEALAATARGTRRPDPGRLVRAARWARSRFAPAHVAARLADAYRRAAVPAAAGRPGRSAS